MIYQCYCGQYAEENEEVCVDCEVNDSIENDSVDKYFEYEDVLKDISEDELKRKNISLKLMTFIL